MAKKKKTKKQTVKPAKTAQKVRWEWFEQHPDAVALGLFCVLAFLFFYQVIIGIKAFVVPDAQSHQALVAPLSQALWQNHVYPQWTPYIFGGMPSFASTMYYPFVYVPYIFLDLLLKILPFAGVFKHIVHYPLAGMGLFLLLRSRGVKFWGGFIGGLTFMFTPFLITMEVFGHGSQMMTATYIPLAIWAVDRLLQNKNWLYLGIAALVIGLQLERAHIQIVYYSWMAIGLYLLFYLIWGRKDNKTVQEMLKGVGLVVGALVLAFSLAAILYLSVYEYTPYSTRGATAGAAGAGGGAGFEYATQWSFHPKEMLTFLIPSFFGFGGQTYWGAMPFTDYPNYMGIIPLALAAFAFVYNRRRIVWYFLTVIILSLLISFGRHFPPVYQFFYNFVPFFNKFRVPVMILILVQFSVGALAGMGLQNILDLARKLNVRDVQISAEKILRISMLAVGLLGAIVLIVSLFSNSFFGFMSSLYPSQYAPNVQQQLNQMRSDMLLKDMWLMMVFLAAALFSFWSVLKKKMQPMFFAFILSAVTVIDLWIVDARIYNPAPAKNMEQYLASNDIMDFLKTDEDLYRIFPLPPLFNDNRWAAHDIASIGGYFPAKLNIIQKFLDDLNLPNGLAMVYYKLENSNGRQGLRPLNTEQIPGRERQTMLSVLNMLNVKYVISPLQFPEPNFQLAKASQWSMRGTPIPMYVYRNTRVLPRAFFVGAFRQVANQDAAMEIITSGEFHPDQYAILETTPEMQPDTSGTASANVTEYELNRMKIQTQSDTPKLLVLSEIYYPKGWKAYIDGKPTEIYKTDALLRSVMVPAGNHEVELIFDSPAFEAGLGITGVGWLIVLGILVVGFRKTRRSAGHGTAKSPTN